MKKIFAILILWLISIIYSLILLFCLYKFPFFKNMILVMEECFHNQNLAIFTFVLLFILLPLGIFHLIYNRLFKKIK